ncbi:epidermal growth factor-like protein 8 [Ruditapes philippinarum]|uniref:epidermal growth factor-like protein 8 n=1 Tax=Ruditapes philippinarum TaxID=129788 RepID=UPI00295AF4F8|nr:epidermal growth factor-like protein 8 [Ruditapes philippinarum]
MKSYFFIFVFAISVTVVASSNFCNYPKTCYGYRYRHCGFGGWRRCGYSYAYTCYPKVCCNGWKDLANGCITPICNTPCYNGGTCVAPDTCTCLSSHQGKYCETYKGSLM